jgi:hypothetical protein
LLAAFVAIGALRSWFSYQARVKISCTSGLRPWG